MRYMIQLNIVLYSKLEKYHCYHKQCCRILCLQLKRIRKFMTNMTLLKYLYCVWRLTFCQLLFMYLGIMYLYELKIVISHGGAGGSSA